MAATQKETEHVVTDLDTTPGELRDIVKASNASYKLKFILGCYESEKNVAYEYFNVKDDKLLGPLQPNKIFMRNIANSVQLKGSHYDLSFHKIPASVRSLKITNEGFGVVWELPAKMRVIKYQDGDEVKKISMHMPVSMLTYKSQNGVLYHFTVEKQKKKIIRRPSFLPNVYQEGNVCLGQNKIRLRDFSTLEELIKHCEAMLWSGIYTSYHNQAGSIMYELIKESSEVIVPVKEFYKMKQL